MSEVTVVIPEYDAIENWLEFSSTRDGPSEETFLTVKKALFNEVAAEAAALIDALETENAQHINAIECLRQERDEIVLALAWCKSRMKRSEYEQHVEWTLAKYQIPEITAALATDLDPSPPATAPLQERPEAASDTAPTVSHAVRRAPPASSLQAPKGETP